MATLPHLPTVQVTPEPPGVDEDEVEAELVAEPLHARTQTR